MQGNGKRAGRAHLAASLCVLMLAVFASEAQSQEKLQGPPVRSAANAKLQPAVRMGPMQSPPPRATVVPPAEGLAGQGPKEKVEADISTRSVEVTAGFTGHEILVFGSIDRNQQPGDEKGFYDIVVVVEGTPFPVVVRHKSDVAGIWINTSSVTFASVPSYYAIASTKPIEEIAGPKVLDETAIGFAHIKMTPAPGYQWKFQEGELAGFKAAVIRLKQKQGLYVVQAKEGVTFIGRSLFRATIALPANVPVGPLVARVYLFRDGEVLSAHIARVTLERAGVERLLHDFAFRFPFTYGMFAVILAVVSGLLASAFFRSSAH